MNREFEKKILDQLKPILPNYQLVRSINLDIDPPRLPRVVSYTLLNQRVASYLSDEEQKNLFKFVTTFTFVLDSKSNFNDVEKAFNHFSNKKTWDNLRDDFGIVIREIKSITNITESKASGYTERYCFDLIYTVKRG